MPSRALISSKSLPLFESADELRLRTWVQLARTFYRISRLIVSALAEHRITLPQFDVLATLRFSEGVTQQELAHRLLVTKGNVCGVLDRLEALKWVERRQDPKDARANRLYLTTAGRKKIDSVLPEHDALVIQTFRTLSSSDVKTLRRLLQELERANAGADRE
jgi:DNA-binding MarR family transcriptional regulator